eukprot:CAMPEP_0119528578 /NCGR_PEP_ID=MMETSP1344-20130328/42741_1 /TAXON_ID=236787 /ORGANISM="Florenciella parvula, Strain CCMP2471" /LENGTH=77 /DNA_ID=CAMNT_0007568003 /DNA_START=124 /DNA_END=353 /DNA_ORIENTATION=-
MLVNRWRNRIQRARGCGNPREDEHHAKAVEGLCTDEASSMVAPSEQRPIPSHAQVSQGGWNFLEPGSVAQHTARPAG